jgi:hypothetical protein
MKEQQAEIKMWSGQRTTLKLAGLCVDYIISSKERKFRVRRSTGRNTWHVINKYAITTTYTLPIKTAQ